MWAADTWECDSWCSDTGDWGVCGGGGDLQLASALYNRIFFNLYCYRPISYQLYESEPVKFKRW